MRVSVLLVLLKMFFSVSASSVVVGLPRPAQAGIDPSALRNLPVEGDSSGTAMRLRQIEAGT